MYKTKNLKKKTKQTNNALSHLEKHSNYDLNFFYQEEFQHNFGFFFSLIQASVTCTFLLFNALYFEFKTCLNNIPHE